MVTCPGLTFIREWFIAFEDPRVDGFMKFETLNNSLVKLAVEEWQLRNAQYRPFNGQYLRSGAKVAEIDLVWQPRRVQQ